MRLLSISPLVLFQLSQSDIALNKKASYIFGICICFLQGLFLFQKKISKECHKRVSDLTVVKESRRVHRPPPAAAAMFRATPVRPGDRVPVGTGVSLALCLRDRELVGLPIRAVNAPGEDTCACRETTERKAVPESSGARPLFSVFVFGRHLSCLLLVPVLIVITRPKSTAIGFNPRPLAEIFLACSSSLALCQNPRPSAVIFPALHPCPPDEILGPHP